MDVDKLFSPLMAFRRRLEAMAQAQTGCSATAEDMVQDAWVKLETARPARVIDNPRGFVTQITKRAVMDHIRKDRRRAEINSELAEILWDRASEVSPERVAISRESLRRVQAVLDTLPDRTRWIFLRNRLDQISHRQIAEELGVTEETVYYHIRRALERLAECRNDAAP